MANAMNQLAAFRDTIVLAEVRGMPECGGELGLSHLRSMYERAESAQFSDSKLGRWLGWAQCAVVAANIGLTLEDMKQINLGHSDQPKSDYVGAIAAIKELVPLAVISDGKVLQSNAWPMGTVVQEIHTGSCCGTEQPFCDFYEQLWVMQFQMGWMRVEAEYFDGADDSPRLPVRLLWHPEWASQPAAAAVVEGR
jgi:hypothetical protein